MFDSLEKGSFSHFFLSHTPIILSHSDHYSHLIIDPSVSMSLYLLSNILKICEEQFAQCVWLVFYRRNGGPVNQQKLPPLVGDSPANRGTGGGLIPPDYVPRIDLEEKIQEALSRDETIQVRHQCLQPVPYSVCVTTESGTGYNAYIYCYSGKCGWYLRS